MLHDDLLEQARHLLRRERRRPRQASLRRAISTAYYALFHLLTTQTVDTVGHSLSQQRRAALGRCFQHADMKRVAKFFLIPVMPRGVLQGISGSVDLQVIASNFVLLQEARHLADYDLGKQYTRFETEQLVGLAEEAFIHFNIVVGCEEWNLFSLALLAPKQFEI